MGQYLCSNGRIRVKKFFGDFYFLLLMCAMGQYLCCTSVKDLTLFTLDWPGTGWGCFLFSRIVTSRSIVDNKFLITVSSPEYTNICNGTVPLLQWSGLWLSYSEKKCEATYYWFDCAFHASFFNRCLSLDSGLWWTNSTRWCSEVIYYRNYLL